MRSLVSVIIPFYSNKEWLKATLESVFSQTFKDFEFLILDDASTDKSLEIILKPKVYEILEENNGNNEILDLNKEIRLIINRI